MGERTRPARATIAMPGLARDPSEINPEICIVEQREKRPVDRDYQIHSQI